MSTEAQLNYIEPRVYGHRIIGDPNDNAVMIQMTPARS